MNLFGAVLLASCLFALASSKGDNLIKIDPDNSIIETPEDYESTLGVVGGAISCGGPAQVQDWRYEPCKGLDVCQAPSDGKKRQCEFTFVPSETISGGIGVRFNVTAEGVSDRTYELAIPDSAIRGGRVYTIRTAGSPTKEFQGKRMTFQYIVYRLVDNSIEACAEAKYDNI